jgi:glutamate racemase
VVACNSATSAALGALEAHVAARSDAFDVVGVVTPESQLAVEATHSGRIGLLATPATVASGAYVRAVHASDPHVELVAVPCPDLAPIIQGGFPFDQRVVNTVRSYCEPLRAAAVDTVILGCTHYPLVAPMLQRTLGRDVALVSSGHAVARRVEHALGVRDIESPREGEGDYRFLCTADVEGFRTLGTRFLQMPLEEVEHVDLPARVPA